MASEMDPPPESGVDEQAERSDERIYCNKCRRKTLHRLLKTTSDERIAEYRQDNWEPTGISLGMVASPQCPLPFRPAGLL